MKTSIKEFVFSQYDSISAFAAAIGWQYSKASRIVNLMQNPTKKDMEDIIATLKIPMDSIAPVFFGTMFA